MEIVLLSNEYPPNTYGGAGFGLSPEGMIYAKVIGKIGNPNIEIRNKFKYQIP